MHILRFDGGSNPNPGKCAGAYVIYGDGLKIIAEGGQYIEKGTNNIGEYTGLIIGLQKCVDLHITKLHVEGDSLLVIAQVAGKWQVKNEGLKPLHKKAVELAKLIPEIDFHHIRREYNSHADSLSDKTLELKMNWEN